MIPPCECAYTGYQLSIITRLRQIVISTIVESSDDIILGGARGEHDYGCRLSLFSELAADTYTIHTGELYIEHDHIVCTLYRLGISLYPVSSESTHDIFVCEISYHGLSECDVVFDEEYMHSVIDYRDSEYIAKYFIKNILYEQCKKRVRR